MFFVESFDSDKGYGVVDTKDGVKEWYDWEELIGIADSVKIAGVKDNNVFLVPLDKILSLQMSRLKLAKRLPIDFELTGTSLGISGNVKGSKVLEIPYGINTVYKCNSAFGNSPVERVILPSSLTKVGHNCFSTDFPNVIECNFPKSLRLIGNSAFQHCKLTSLSMEGKDDLTLSSLCFADSSLRSVYIHSGAVDLQSKCFSSCKELTDVCIEGYLSVELEMDVFNGCDNLETVELSGVSLGSNCTKLFIGYEFLKSVKLSVISLCDVNYLFADCISLKEVSIHMRDSYDTDVSFGCCCFENCSSLEKVSLPTRMTDIGVATFRRCTSLKSVKVPEGVEELKYYCFCDCVSLEEISLPSTLKVIDSSAFEGVSNLRKVTCDNRVIIRRLASLCRSLRVVEYRGEVYKFDTRQKLLLKFGSNN